MSRLSGGTIFMVHLTRWPTPGWSDSNFAKSWKGEATASTPAEIPGKILPLSSLVRIVQDQGPGGGEGIFPGALQPLAGTRAPSTPALCPFPSLCLALYVVGGPRSRRAVISGFQEPQLSPSPRWGM